MAIVKCLNCGETATTNATTHITPSTKTAPKSANASPATLPTATTVRSAVQWASSASRRRNRG